MVDYIKSRYVAVAIDGYWPGNDAEADFVSKVAAGANRFTYATAGGKPLGSDYLGESPEQMKKVAEAWKEIPEAERKPRLEKSQGAGGGKVVPKPPVGGLILDVYCVYLDRDEGGKLSRVKRLPLWQLVEPEPDKMWLTEAEWKSLIPKNPRKGDAINVSTRLQKRILCKHATEFIGGSVSEKTLHSGEVTLKVDKVSPEGVTLRLEGFGKLGKAYEDYKPPGAEGEVVSHAYGEDEDGHAGVEVQLLGFLNYNPQKQAFDRFDIVALGDSWGYNPDTIRGAVIRGGRTRRWPYGVAFELNKGQAPIDQVVPYNMLAYSSTKYFEE